MRFISVSRGAALAAFVVCGLGAATAGQSAQAAQTAVSTQTNPVQASTSTAAKATCAAPVYFIGVRGSGELAQGNNGMGKEVNYMATRVRSDLADYELNVAFKSVNYPAVSTDVLKPTSTVLTLLKVGSVAPALALYAHTSTDRFDSSLDQGITQTEAAVAQVLKSCPTAEIIMAGYSQGAAAVHDAENWLQTNKPAEFEHIAGTLLVADPDRVPNTGAEQFGDSLAAGEGVRVYLHLVKAHDVPEPETTANVTSIDDFVGDFQGPVSIENWKADTAVHTSYYTTITGKALLTSAADWVASLFG
jgi:hypothetical protein